MVSIARNESSREKYCQSNTECKQLWQWEPGNFDTQHYHGFVSLAVIPRSNLEVGNSFQKSLKSAFLLKTVKENTLMLPYFNNRKTNFSEIEKGIVR